MYLRALDGSGSCQVGDQSRKQCNGELWELLARREEGQHRKIQRAGLQSFQLLVPSEAHRQLGMNDDLQLRRSPHNFGSEYLRSAPTAFVLSVELMRNVHFLRHGGCDCGR